MASTKSSLAILADPHSNMIEGMRCLLETAFSDVFVVSSAHALLAGAKQLQPALIVFDVSIATGQGTATALINELRQASPASGLVALTLHELPAVAEVVMNAGADAVILKRSIARDLMTGVDAVERGERFVSPDILAGHSGIGDLAGQK